MAGAAVIEREAEVEADRFRVADVQIAVGLGRKARADRGRVGGRAALHRRRPGTARPAAPAYLPLARSASMTWRMKFETAASPFSAETPDVRISRERGSSFVKKKRLF